MAGIAYVQVTEDQLKKIPCPTCKKVGTLQFVSDGSSAVLEGAAGGRRASGRLLRRRVREQRSPFGYSGRCQSTSRAGLAEIRRR